MSIEAFYCRVCNFVGAIMWSLVLFFVELIGLMGLWIIKSLKWFLHAWKQNWSRSELRTRSRFTECFILLGNAVLLQFERTIECFFWYNRSNWIKFNTQNMEFAWQIRNSLKRNYNCMTLLGFSVSASAREH